VKKSAHVCTDSFASYDRLGARFAAHGTVNHSKNEWRKGYVHTNTIEGYFSLVKRGLTGIYHKVSQEHLHRYLAEFDFRYNNRKIKDVERAQKMLMASIGKRLLLREPSNDTSLTA
jgi:transposase-like protein